MKVKRLSIVLVSLLMAVLIVLASSCSVRKVNKETESTEKEIIIPTGITKESTTAEEIITTSDSTKEEITTVTEEVTTTTEETKPEETTTQEIVTGVSEEYLNSKLEELRSELLNLFNTISSLEGTDRSNIETLIGEFIEFSSSIREEISGLKTVDTGIAQTVSDALESIQNDFQKLNGEYIIILNQLADLSRRITVLENNETSQTDKREWVEINGVLVYGNTYTIIRKRATQDVTIKFYSRTAVEEDGDIVEADICIKEVKYNVPYYFDTLYIGNSVIAPTLESNTNFVYEAEGYYKLTEDGGLYLDAGSILNPVDITSVSNIMYKIIKADFQKSYCNVYGIDSILIVNE